MWFVVTGVRQGKTFKGGSQGSPLHFKDGMIEVPDDARDLHNLLSNFYEAYPAHQIKQQEDGTLIRIQPEEGSNSVKPQFALPVAVKELPVDGASATEGEGMGTQPPVFEKPKPVADKPKK